jgi:aspartate aminotransferase-like enzyme
MKRRMFTPGPTPVPEETLLEMAKPVFYHRSSEFYKLMAEVSADLQTVFCTRNPVLTLTCSGTGGLEAALVNTVPAGRKVICLIAGRFGERWRHICAAFGIEPVVVDVPYGRAVRPEQLEQALGEHPDAVAVCSTLSETSTGVAHDIEAFGKLVARTEALFLVDAISGLGAMECRTDAWDIDICCAGSQKALMLPPGLAFVSVSDKAWKVIEGNPSPRSFYFDLKKARAKWEANDTPYTPAHTLIRGLRVSLKKIVTEGMDKIWQRQARHAAAARAGFEAMGLEIFPKPPNNALTVVKVPADIDGTVLLETLEKRYGIKLANGQGLLTGKIFRLGHMGYIDQFDILAALSGVELVLHEMGFGVELGSGLAAAQRSLALGVSQTQLQ